MAEYSDREQCSFFEHIALLSVEERNELDAYLHSLPEFREWDELGFLMSLNRQCLKASARSGAPVESMDRACRSLLPSFRRYKEMSEVLRQKVKNWCRAMVDEAV